MLSDSSTTAAADRAHTDIKTLYSKVMDAVNFISSGPHGTIPKKYLDQLLAEVDTLHHSTLKNYDRRIQELQSGTNSEIKKSLMKNRRDEVFKSGQTEKSPKSQFKKHHQDEEAIQYALDHPNDPLSAAILKANGL